MGYGNGLALRNRKVLVTGGCGFIGSALVRTLVRECEAQVLNLDKLTYAGSPSTVAAVAQLSGYKFARIDIRDGARLDDAIRRFEPDAVVHLAAESHVDRSIDGPADFIQTNVIGTYALLETSLRYHRSLPEAKRQQFRFLHISTDEVYGALGHDDAPFTEETQHRPNSPYSASKAASDHLAAAWRHTFGVPTLITNCGNNYGLFQFPEKFIPTLIIRALKGQELPIYGGGSNARDWIHVEDHARALLGVLAFGRVGGKYLIGAGEQCRNLDLAEMICDLVDCAVPRNQPSRALLTHVADRPGHDHRYAIDPSRIRAEIGWRPQRSLAEGLESTVRWYIDHKDWWEGIFRSGRYGGERLGLDPRHPRRQVTGV